jgi:hypothetical protein
MRLIEAAGMEPDKPLAEPTVAKIAIRVICAAWFLSMLLLGGLGRWALDTSEPAVDFLLGRSDAVVAAPVAVPTARADPSVLSDEQERAKREGWGAGQALPAEQLGDQPAQ